jgi:hypothetical protein
MAPGRSRGLFFGDATGWKGGSRGRPPPFGRPVKAEQLNECWAWHGLEATPSETFHQAFGKGDKAALWLWRLKVGHYVEEGAELCNDLRVQPSA